MKNFELKELNAQELENLNGGIVFLAAIPLTKVFIAGFTTGAAIGGIVLDNLLSKK